MLQLFIKLLDKLLRRLIHLTNIPILLRLFQRERRIRYPQLPHRRALPKPRQVERRRLGNLVIQDIKHLLDDAHVILATVVVAATAMVVVVFAAGVVRGISRAVAAAELVLSRGDKGERGVVRAAAQGGGVLVVEGEVLGEGFSGNLPLF